ncbi:MAG: hypothetical protein ACRDZX_10575 [Acidimicrobiales bacterium]
MNRSRVGAAAAGAVAAGPLTWALYYFGVAREALALRVGAGLFTVVVLVALLPLLWRQRPHGSLLEEALRSRQPSPPARPASLRQLEFALRLACFRSGRWDVHFRLRPVLRQLAAHRLRSRRLVELDGDLAAARRLLGEDLWQLVRADRAEPARAKGRGLRPAELSALVERLESL